MGVGKDFDEGSAFGHDAVVCDEPPVDDGQTDVEDTDAGAQLRDVW